MAPRHAPLMLACATVRGFPSFRDHLPNGRRVPCPEGGQECQPGDPAQCEAELTCSGLGHATCRGGTLPLNVFGAAFEDAGHSWTRELCEADSDGDGLSNGEELGDPCCLWVKGSAPSEYTKRFTPSHPGFADASATVDAYSRPTCGDTGPIVAGERFGEFNDGEEQLFVDVLIKSHNVPAQRTSYINFMINIPDSAWDAHPGSDFYVVKGDAVVDKQEVLHHYIINGCSKKVPAELDGVPTSTRTARDYDCSTSFGGWAPGAHIWNMPPWIGVPFGPNAGIVAFDVQIHYDNPREASDIWDASGMRFSYTPSARPYPLSIFTTMKVSVNPQVVIPPKTARWFLTRTCTVDIADGEEFHLFGVNYHAHLLGVQMYTEYFPVAGGDPMDLGSEQVWYFDDQYTRDLLAFNVTLRTGDVLQSTCVMSSLRSEEATIFGLETTDEMCWAKYSGWSSVLGRSASVTCDGPVWQGELLPTEPAFGLAARRPVEKAMAVWDGSDHLTGGTAVRLPGGDACVDRGVFCGRMGMTLDQLGTTGCNQDLATVPVWSDQEALHGRTFEELCCATTCAHEACHATPTCLLVREEQLRAHREFDVYDTIALSSEPFYSIRTMGCSSDAAMLKTVSVPLPDELLTEAARAQGSEDGDANLDGKSNGGADGARGAECFRLFLPLLMWWTA